MFQVCIETKNLLSDPDSCFKFDLKVTLLTVHWYYYDKIFHDLYSYHLIGYFYNQHNVNLNSFN